MKEFLELRGRIARDHLAYAVADGCEHGNRGTIRNAGCPASPRFVQWAL